ncbi:MAG TPA: ABC transporter permease, partial [Steroidobacteraceae bacterium]|nr:ABC transporter permease [Steroidobacteraceae bacterium]
MGNTLRQTALLTVSGLRSLGQRRAVALVTIVSVMAVVCVLISLLAIREGTSIFQPTRTDEAIVLSRGAGNVSQSHLSREDVATIAQTPGIKWSAERNAFVYASTVISVDALRRDGKRGAVNLAGYAQGWERVEGELKVTAGRLYRPAVRELMVSESIRKMYRGFDVGERIMLRGTEWTVVGVFAAKDSQTDGLVLSDAETVNAAFGRNSFGQVKVRLESPATYQLFADSLARNPTLRVDVKTTNDEFEQTFGGMRRLLTFVSYFIGALMASGAICGALNSVYASVDARRREIATVRALGFRGLPVIASILTESMLLAFPGALLGA